MWCNTMASEYVEAKVSRLANESRDFQVFSMNQGLVVKILGRTGVVRDLGGYQ